MTDTTAFQPLHVAQVARLPRDTSDRDSAVLVARAMGYLAVRVQFHGLPVEGLKVTFCRLADIDDEDPAPMDPVRVSAADGIAFYPRLVPAGLYGLEVEHEPQTVVPTVISLDQPHPVVLPVGRPLVDIGDFEEFVLRP